MEPFLRAEAADEWLVKKLTELRGQRRACPQCGHNDQVAQLAYGLPTMVTVEAAEHGWLQLLGCVIWDEDLARQGSPSVPP